MKNIKIKTGDLLEATEDIIAHQVNCHGIAGGLAYHVFNKYPDAENVYLQMIDRLGGSNMLGMAVLTGQQKDGHIVANLYGQYFPGQDYRPDALEKSLNYLATFAKNLGKSVALPYKLSCGICGGDWNEVQEIIERTMDGVECVIYRREGDE